MLKAMVSPSSTTGLVLKRVGQPARVRGRGAFTLPSTRSPSPSFAVPTWLKPGTGTKSAVVSPSCCINSLDMTLRNKLPESTMAWQATLPITRGTKFLYVSWFGTRSRWAKCELVMILFTLGLLLFTFCLFVVLSAVAASPGVASAALVTTVGCCCSGRLLAGLPSFPPHHWSRRCTQIGAVVAAGWGCPGQQR